ncbi:MAG: ParA family protein [Proteobacteria bacterium]|nr:MAG: ParA family protein [Pseudomonadota bacterium]
MTSFKDMVFTPAEFAMIAKLDKTNVPQLEIDGKLTTTRRKIGNVERKVISLEDMQRYFQNLRWSSTGLGAVAGDRPYPIESHTADAVAAATGFNLEAPRHKTQMFYNVKGGTGKSTLTAQYVMRAAMMGYRVLAIDLDGQGHLTVNLDILDAHERPTVYDVLINDLPMSQAIMNVAPCLDLVPANLGLCNIEIPLNNKPRREYRLGEAIAKIWDQYDLIVADTNPAASILNGSMLVASELVNVVCATNPLSFHGMSLVMATIEEMQREFQRDLDVKIIPNMYDNREVISQEVLGELRSQFVEYCAKTVMNRSADINEATKRRTTVWDVNSKGVAAQDVNSLTEELLFT